jgi:hypothetical protein
MAFSDEPDEPYVAYPPFPGLEKHINGWNAERRARQAAAIGTWKPWARSTGPRTAAGKARSSRNSYKNGMYNAEMQLLQAALRRYGSMIRTAERLFPAKMKNELMDKSLFKMVYGLLERQRLDIERQIDAIMQKPCICGPPEGKS